MSDAPPFLGYPGAIPASGVTYDGIPPSPSTNVEEELDHRARHTGAGVEITSYADLVDLFPPAAGVHSVSGLVRFTSFDGLPNAVTIVALSPTILTVDSSPGPLISGNAPGPLISGQVTISGLQIFNAGGLDAEIDDPGVALLQLNKVVFLGRGLVIKNTAGVLLDHVVMAPQIPGSAGIVVTKVATVSMTEAVFIAPGGSQYTGFSVADTATIIRPITVRGTNFSGQLATDAPYYIDPIATIPGSGPAPIAESAARFIGTTIQNPSISPPPLFAAGSLDLTSSNIIASGGQNAEDTHVIGDAFVTIDDAVNPAINIDFSAVVIDTKIVVPADNGEAPGPTFEGLALFVPPSSHFELLTPTPTTWSLRYDGPDLLTVKIVWSMDIKKDGASNVVTGWARQNAVFIEQSASTPLLLPTVTASMSGSAIVQMVSGDMFDLVASSGGNSAGDITRISFIIEPVA